VCREASPSLFLFQDASLFLSLVTFFQLKRLYSVEWKNDCEWLITKDEDASGCGLFYFKILRETTENLNHKSRS
jgi:hypothetical protein